MVSVIIPNYNHAGYLEQRIQSVLNQTYDNFEVIILDDCSTDESRRIIEQYRNHPKVSHVVYNEFNSGSTFRQWQKGLGLAKGEWIWIAESDDYSTYTFLSELITFISNNTNIGLIYCKSNLVDENGNMLKEKALSIYNEFLLKQNENDSWVEQGWTVFRDQLLIQCTIPNASAVLVRKELLERFVGQSCCFKLTGDWLLWSTISFYSTVAFYSRPLNFFRNHKGNVRAAIASLKLKAYEYGQIRNRFESIISDLPVSSLEILKLKALNRKLKGVDLGYMSMEDLRNRKFLLATCRMFQSIYYCGFEKEFLLGFIYWLRKNLFFSSWKSKLKLLGSR